MLPFKNISRLFFLLLSGKKSPPTRWLVLINSYHRDIFAIKCFSQMNRTI